MRFLLRLVGSLFLAVGVVFAVGDIARSLAADATRLLPVGESLALLGVDFDPAATGSATVAVAYAAISNWSMAVTAGAIGVVLLLLGRKPRRVRRDALR
ncbi:MAG TPA: hypothetical protein VGO17_07305 [Aurantimonas sp.]|jgi:hypothetical protein|nr:hypothetical protein [Aurantimonas sp.]